MIWKLFKSRNLENQQFYTVKMSEIQTGGLPFKKKKKKKKTEHHFLGFSISLIILVLKIWAPPPDFSTR